MTQSNNGFRFGLEAEFMLADACLWLVLFGAIASLSVFLPAELGDKYDPVKWGYRRHTSRPIPFFATVHRLDQYLPLFTFTVFDPKRDLTLGIISGQSQALLWWYRLVNHAQIGTFTGFCRPVIKQAADFSGGLEVLRHFRASFTIYLLATQSVLGSSVYHSKVCAMS